MSKMDLSVWHHISVTISFISFQVLSLILLCSLTILGDNGTVIQSGVILFKVIAVPTYMFILGVIAGVLAISFVLIWRYVILILNNTHANRENKQACID